MELEGVLFIYLGMDGGRAEDQILQDLSAREGGS